MTGGVHMMTIFYVKTRLMHHKR